MTFSELLDSYEWTPLAGCTGRYRAPLSLCKTPFEDLTGVRPIRQKNAHCRDVLLYAPLVGGGGVISYEKPDGRILHTLGDLIGYQRKLRLLGLLNVDNTPLCPECQEHRFQLEFKAQRLLWCPSCDTFEHSSANFAAWIKALHPASSNPREYLKHEHYQHAYYVEEFRKALQNLLSSCGAPIKADSLFEKNIDVTHGTFMDPRDQQVYRTVRIGSQTWMAQNMNYKVPKGVTFAAEQDPLDTMRVDGLFYDWATAQQAAPPGWHVPSAEEWSRLANYITLHSDACKDNGKAWSGVGFELKAPECWLHSPPDRFGFSAQCTGIYCSEGYPLYQTMASWWTSTPQGPDAAMLCSIARTFHFLSIYSFDNKILSGVRCIQDDERYLAEKQRQSRLVKVETPIPETLADEPPEKPATPTFPESQTKGDKAHARGWKNWLKRLLP